MDLSLASWDDQQRRRKSLCTGFYSTASVGITVGFCILYSPRHEDLECMPESSLRVVQDEGE